MYALAPKNKFTREEMVAAAVQVVRKNGAEGLTAKSVAEELAISTQPIFTCFATMEALRADVLASAEKIYADYCAKGLEEPVPFFGFGMRYIRFAKEEPQLYRLVFLSDESNALNSEGNAIKEMRRSQKTLRPLIMDIYKLTEAEADLLFHSLWLVVHSIATLYVTGGCSYTENRIGKILMRFCLSTCKSIKEIKGFTDGSFDRDVEFKKLIK